MTSPRPANRLTDFSTYWDGFSPHFAGIWIEDGRSHRVRLGIHPDDWQDVYDDESASRDLTHFVASGSGPDVRFGAVFTEGVWPQYEHRAGLSAEEYQAEHERQTTAGFRLVEVVGYDDSRRFAGLWAKGVAGSPHLM